MKKHRNIILLSLIVLFILAINSSICYAAGPDQGMFPDVSELFNGQSKSKYLSQYRDNYYLDLKETGVFKSFDFNIFNGFANLLFQAQKGLTYVILIIVYYAFELKFTDLMDPVLTSVISALGDSIFNQFVLMFISLLGIFYVIKIVKDQKTQIWMAILQTVAIVAIAMFFITSPTKFLNGIDDLSEGVSKAVLENTFKATHKGEAPDTATIAVCEDLWVMFVHKPWQILECGSTKTAEEHEENILTKKPDAKERQEYVNDAAKSGELFSPVWGLGRLSAITLYIIPLLIQMCLVGILCLLVIMYKALMITTAMFGPFVFLLALIPWFGFRAINSWISKLVGYGGMKIILAFFVTILFAFTIAIYSYTDKYGWMFVLLTQVTVTYGIYWKRDKFFDFIIVARDSLNKGHIPVNRELRKDANIENYLRNLRFRKGNGNFDESTDDTQDGTQVRNRGKWKSEGDTDLGGRYGDDDSNTSSKKNKSAKTKYKGYKDKEYQDRNYNNESSRNTSTNSDQSLKGLLKIAEDILEQQYENSRRSAEEKAEATGKEPDYDYSVRKVMNREKMNLPKYDEREKLAVAKQLERVVKAGGDPEELYNERIQLETPDEEVERPGGIVIKHNGQEETINDGDLEEELSIPERSKKYTKDFNETYGKNYDPRFMEKLMKRYGSNNVQRTLENMEKISNREGIRNPAGYLTESLKNNSLNKEYYEEDFQPEEDFRPERVNINPEKVNVNTAGNESDNEEIKLNIDNSTSNDPMENINKPENSTPKSYRNVRMPRSSSSSGINNENMNNVSKNNMREDYLSVEDTIRPSTSNGSENETTPVKLNIDNDDGAIKDEEIVEKIREEKGASQSSKVDKHNDSNAKYDRKDVKLKVNQESYVNVEKGFVNIPEQEETAPVTLNIEKENNNEEEN